MGLSNDLSCEAGSLSCCRPNPHGVFTQRFEALFPRAGALGCVVCLAPPLFLPVYLRANVGPWGLLAVALPAPSLHNPPPRWVCQPSPCHGSSPPRLLVSAPPTGLDECLFFISLVSDFLAIRFSVSSGCARRHSVSPLPPYWFST